MSAAKTIIKAWVTFRDSKRYEVLLDNHRTELYDKKLARVREARLSVIEDLKEVHKDLKLCIEQQERCKKRIKELDTFHVESDSRIALLEEEIENVEPEDRERGWEEAFINEYECLVCMREHCLQELRLWRNNVLKRKREALLYECEIEETEHELEELTLVECEIMEQLRRWEIGRVEKRLNDRFRRELRRQRCRWKIKGHRANVVKKRRENYQHVKEEAESKRGIAYATTVTYEKRAQQWDLEELTIDRFQHEQGLKVEAGMVRKYEDYAVPVQETYDDVVANTLSLLKGWTVDARAEKVRTQLKAEQAKKKKAHMGQFGSLKFMNEDTGAFAYLKKDT